MNTYHFVNDPVDGSDINRLLKKLEQAVADSFTRQVKNYSENDGSVVIINNFVSAEERVG